MHSRNKSYRPGGDIRPERLIHTQPRGTTSALAAPQKHGGGGRFGDGYNSEKLNNNVLKTTKELRIGSEAHSPSTCEKIHDRPTSRSHPRRRLTAVPDDEQLKEVIVVPGHAGSWWLTPALCRFFSPFAVRPPRFAGRPHQPPDTKETENYGR